MGRSSPEGFFKDTYDLFAFTTKALHPLRPGADHAITLRAFDHRVYKPLDDDSVEVPPQAVVIIEGMFVLRRTLQLVGHVHLLGRAVLDHGPAHGSARWRSSGPRSPSWRRYLQGQDIYLSACEPTERATYVIDNY